MMRDYQCGKRPSEPVSITLIIRHDQPLSNAYCEMLRGNYVDSEYPEDEELNQNLCRKSILMTNRILNRLKGLETEEVRNDYLRSLLNNSEQIVEVLNGFDISSEEVSTVEGPHWRLIDTKVDLAQRWDSPAAGFQGSFATCEIGSSSMTAHMFNQTTAGVFLSEADVTYSFDVPPSVIAAGETTPPLQMTAKITGRVEGAPCPPFFAHYLRNGDGNRISPNISVPSVCRAISVGPSEFEVMPQVRFPSSGTMFSVASRLLFNNVGCKIEWTYEFVPEN